MLGEYVTRYDEASTVNEDECLILDLMNEDSESLREEDREQEAEAVENLFVKCVVHVSEMIQRINTESSGKHCFNEDLR